MGKLKSLRWKMLVPIMTAVIVIIGAFALFIYNAAEKSVRANGEALVESIAIGMNSTIHSREKAERIMEQEMLSQSVMASYILAQGATHQDMKTLAERAKIDEIWSTDDKGNTTITSIAPQVDFNFGQDPNGQAAVYMKLIDGSEKQIVQPAQNRDIDGQFYKFVGVGGWQKPQIVQVARNGQDLVVLEEDIGSTAYIQQLRDNLSKTVLYASVVDEAGNVIAATQEGEVPLTTFDATKTTSATGKVNGTAVRNYAKPLADGTFLVVAVSTKVLSQIVQATLLAAIVANILIIGIASLVISHQVKRILNVRDSLAAIGAGDADLTKRITIKSDDEIGALVGSFNSMMEKFQQMMQSFSRESAEIFTSVDQVKHNAEATITSSQAIQQGATAIDEASTMQLASTTESAQAMDELARGIQHTSESIAQIADISHDTERSANEGVTILNDLLQQLTDVHDRTNQAVTRTEELVKLSDMIGEFTGVITNISDQTNLLALNASIEAARAGEAGKGFAVVAEEVRKLAEESKTAADRISGVVLDVQKETGNIVDAIHATAQVLEEGRTVANNAQTAFSQIVDGINHMATEVDSVSSATEQIAASTEEISATFDQVADASRQTVAQVHDMVDSTEEQRASMDALAQDMDKLHSIATEFERTTSQFKV
ncbi:methyl-accepting chemotaxis protein [Metalysinibacillus jejuensis]|uniref:methyl-accepting chemotaxis protein n=1 Tax=Metalysinibacillus jejuensis TaxID=914327 RepID=UPI003D084D4C